MTCSKHHRAVFIGRLKTMLISAGSWGFVPDCNEGLILHPLEGKHHSTARGEKEGRIREMRGDRTGKGSPAIGTLKLGSPVTSIADFWSEFF